MLTVRLLIRVSPDQSSNQAQFLRLRCTWCSIEPGVPETSIRPPPYPTSPQTIQSEKTRALRQEVLFPSGHMATLASFHGPLRSGAVAP